MSNNHMGQAPDPIIGGTTLVSNELPVTGGTIHNTVVITPGGQVTNNHLTYTPISGGRKTSMW
ncbi:hypothetical protein GYB22_12680 [bacterium]|nr:hypothetical protein [bacterium]